MLALLTCTHGSSLTSASSTLQACEGRANHDGSNAPHGGNPVMCILCCAASCLIGPCKVLPPPHWPTNARPNEWH